VLQWQCVAFQFAELYRLENISFCCSVLQCVAVCCSVLQCVTVCCSGSASLFSLPKLFGSKISVLVAECCSVLQRVVVCCSVLQCVAVCYSMLQWQCVAV